MRIKIKVGDGLLDLLEGTDDLFYITKQINNLSNLQSRNADFTRTLTIPRSYNNLSLLQMESNERIGNKSFQCSVLADEITVIPSGTLLIIYDNQYEIEIFIGSGNFDIFDSIPNKSIRDLDFSQYNFAWTAANLATLNSTTEGVLVAAIQWLNYESLDTGLGVPSQLEQYQDINTYGFSMHMKTILLEILNQSGYTYNDSDISTGGHYSDMVLACPVQVPPLTAASIYANWSITPSWTYDNGDTGNEVNIPFNQEVADLEDLWDNGNKYYVIDNAGNYKITLNFNIDYVRGADTTPCVLRIEKNGDLLTQTQLPNTGNYNGNIFAIDDFAVNDQIQATIQCGYKNGSKYDTATVNVSSNFDLAENVDDPTGNLVVSDWLPDVNQRDFLRDSLKLFNALLSANPFSKQVDILYWNDYTANTPQDFSNNVDVSQVVTNKISMPGYYRESLMTYSNDSDVTRTNASVIADFGQDESLPPYGTILQLGFSGSEQGQNSIGPLTSITCPYFEASWRTEEGFNITQNTNSFTFDGDVTLYAGEYIRNADRIERVREVTTKRAGTFFNDWDETLAGADIEILTFNQVELTPRIGIVNRSTQTNALWLTNNTYGPDADVITVVQSYDVEFLDFNTILSTYYNKIFNALQTPKIKTVWMIFNTVEFINIDMLRPVFIQSFNGLYYINKIEQYKLNAPCKVELIRITSFTSNTY